MLEKDFPTVADILPHPHQFTRRPHLRNVRRQASLRVLSVSA